MASQAQILAESKISKNVYVDRPVGNALAVLASGLAYDTPHTHKKRVWRHLCNPCAGETQEREIEEGHSHSQRRDYQPFSRVQGIRTSQDMTCRNVIKLGQNRKLTDVLKLKIMCHKGEYCVSELNSEKG